MVVQFAAHLEQCFNRPEAHPRFLLEHDFPQERRLVHTGTIECISPLHENPRAGWPTEDPFDSGATPLPPAAGC